MRVDTYIPRRLDDQWKLGLWDVDVALPFLFALFFGWMASTKTAMAVCVLIGIALSRRVSRIKAQHHPAFMLHWMTWYLPPTPLTALKATPPSALRRLIG